MGVYDWRNKAGQQVYDPSLNGGKGDYTAHATAKDRQYGDNLRNSGEKGAEQFNTLVTSETKVTVTFSSENYGSGDMYGFGFTDTNKPGDVTSNVNGNGTVNVTSVNSAEIIVYEGTAERYVNDVNNGTVKVDASNPNEVADAKSVKQGGLTPADVVSATLGHEIDHINPKNVGMSRNEDKGIFRTDGTNSETVPQNTKTEILKDMTRN